MKNTIKIDLMKSNKNFIYLTFIFFLILSCSKATKLDSLKILFIGNSYTYYNSSPELLKALVKEKYPDKLLEIQLVSQGGMTLKRHWEEGRAVEAIKSNDWDYVVLQEQSKLGMGLIIDNDFYFGQTDNFFNYARKFDAEIKNIGAQTAFFMTWSIKQRSEEQDILTHAYSSIAKELDAELIPIGLVWDKVRSNDMFNLYDLDGSHPSVYGSFLVATSVFSSLLDESPIGLSSEISGFNLSSAGKPSIEEGPLINISKDDAIVIQEASWEVVEGIRNEGGYVDIDEPKQSYKLPKLIEGKKIESKLIEGRWYGTSTYSTNYLGMILDIESSHNSLNVALTFYSPDKQDEVFVKDVELKESQLNMIIIDSLRSMNSSLSFTLNKDQLSGLSKSFGSNFTNYKHWNFSREKIRQKIDLEEVDVLMKSFKKDIEKIGYARAAINHYERYSSITNQTYVPEEMYLNAVGYNYIQDKKLKDALDIFELATILYPESVNTYSSYGETLIKAGEFEKGLIIYTKGYELAKKTGNENAKNMEANIKRFKEGKSNEQQQNALPPPPPPPTGI